MRIVGEQPRWRHRCQDGPRAVSAGRRYGMRLIGLDAPARNRAYRFGRLRRRNRRLKPFRSFSCASAAPRRSAPLPAPSRTGDPLLKLGHPAQQLVKLAAAIHRCRPSGRGLIARRCVVSRCSLGAGWVIFGSVRVGREVRPACHCRWRRHPHLGKQLADRVRHRRVRRNGRELHLPQIEDPVGQRRKVGVCALAIARHGASIAWRPDEPSRAA